MKTLDPGQLMADTRRLYTEMLDSYASAGRVLEHELNLFWSGQNLLEMRRIIADSEDAVDALLRVQTTELFQVNSANEAKHAAVDWHLRLLARSGCDLFTKPEALQESAYSPSAMRVTRCGREFTPDFFRILHHALSATRFCTPAHGRPRYFELGAGCGHLARLLTILHPHSRYAIVDTPETLCFSYMFLRLNFPERSAGVIASRSDISDHVFEDVDFVFVPTLFADELLRGRFDVFVNTASMGEMKNEIVRRWMDFVQYRLQPTYLFTVNRYLNTMEPGPHDWRLGENECSVHYDNRWDILHWELEPPYFRCPYILPRAARHLEIIAKRLPAPSVEGKERSRKSLGELKLQDWVQCESESPAMTLRDHVLCADLTIDGPLFTLWNAMRLDPSVDALVLMLKLLETFLQRPDREFEEVFYYEELLERMLGAAQPTESAGLLEWVRERRRNRKRDAVITLVKSIAGYNIVQVGDDVLALAQSLGPVDLRTERIGDRELLPYIVRGSDLDSLEERIRLLTEGESAPADSRRSERRI